jgi:hypothetical protein
MELMDASIDDLVGRLAVLFEKDRATVRRDTLLPTVAAWEKVGVLADAARTWAAAEVAEESRFELGAESLAVQNGFPSAKKLLAAVTGCSLRTAGARISLGSRLRPNVSLTGLVAPSAFPAVEAAFYSGRIGVDAAAVITGQLAEVAKHTGWSEAVREAEVRLVEEAEQSVAGVGYSADQLLKLAVRIRQNLDPDGTEPRHDEQVAKRELKWWECPDGMTRGTFALTPEDAGVWKAALAGHLSPKTTPRLLTDAEAAVEKDPRTRGQIAVDAITGILAKAVGLDPDAPTLQGAAPVLNVHVSLDDLTAGKAIGWVDGVTEPVPPSVVEQLTCHADILTTVFGVFGEVLHHGKKKRLFTPAIIKAAAARDGGCVWPGCEVPPWACEAHHIIEWGHDDHPPGVTDVCNCALLCPFHHANLHRSEWRLIMVDGVPHMVPPVWLDPEQTPRPAGQQRARRRREDAA